MQYSVKLCCTALKIYSQGKTDYYSMSFKQVVQSATKPLDSTIHLVSHCLIETEVFAIYIISLIYQFSVSGHLVFKREMSLPFCIIQIFHRKLFSRWEVTVKFKQTCFSCGFFLLASTLHSASQLEFSNPSIVE